MISLLRPFFLLLRVPFPTHHNQLFALFLLHQTNDLTGSDFLFHCASPLPAFSAHQENRCKYEAKFNTRTLSEQRTHFI